MINFKLTHYDQYVFFFQNKSECNLIFRVFKDKMPLNLGKEPRMSRLVFLEERRKRSTSIHSVRCLSSFYKEQFDEHFNEYYIKNITDAYSTIARSDKILNIHLYAVHSVSKN